MHYNEGADLLTYLVDPSVFAIKNGYVEALTGVSFSSPSRSLLALHRLEHEGPGLGIEINENLVREMAAKHASEAPWRNAVFTSADGAIQEW